MASGAPDYWQSQVPGRTILRTGQVRWELIVDVEVPPGDTGIVPLYLVPAGKQLSITFVKASSKQVSNAYGTFYRNSDSCGSFYVHEAFIFSTGETGAYTFLEGEVFGFGANNFMSFTLNVTFKVAGTLTDV